MPTKAGRLQIKDLHQGKIIWMVLDVPGAPVLHRMKVKEVFHTLDMVSLNYVDRHAGESEPDIFGDQFPNSFATFIVDDNPEYLRMSHLAHHKLPNGQYFGTHLFVNAKRARHYMKVHHLHNWELRLKLEQSGPVLRDGYQSMIDPDHPSNEMGNGRSPVTEDGILDDREYLSRLGNMVPVTSRHPNMHELEAPKPFRNQQARLAAATTDYKLDDVLGKELGPGKVKFGDMDRPMDIYGDQNNYKKFPDINEEVREDGLLMEAPKEEFPDYVGMMGIGEMPVDEDLEKERKKKLNARLENFMGGKKNG